MENNRTPSCVVTASAGNFAQGLLYCTRKLGIPCIVVVPDHAPETKLAAMARLDPNVTIIKVPFAAWWDTLMTGRHASTPADATFISPVTNRDVMAGNGTIGLEIMDQCGDVDAVIIPYGGGALAVGVASAVKHINPKVKCYAVESDQAAPLAASFKAGKPTEFAYQPSFIDGMGGKSVVPELVLSFLALLHVITHKLTIYFGEKVADGVDVAGRLTRRQCRGGCCGTGVHDAEELCRRRHAKYVHTPVFVVCMERR